MNRLQKKCMIVSGGIHLLLAVMLILGPAFLSSRMKEDAPPLLNFVPGATVEALISGGGDNRVKTPPAEATAPAPQTIPTPVVSAPPQVPMPPVDRTPPPKIENDPIPAVKEQPRVEDTPKFDPTPAKPAPRKREINVSTKIVTSSAEDAKSLRDAQAKAAKAAAAAAAAEQKRIATALGRATAGIRGGVSGITEIRMPGIGTGGVAYGNIKSAIYSRYYDAWKVPDGAPDSTVMVSITLARDGSVVSARITDRSGNSALDDSVQRALDRVKFIAPLPESETHETREFNFGFNPEMKSSG